VLGGGTRRYANLDHAASTPPFLAVLDAVNRFSSWYANVHRGTGFKSRLSSWVFDDARHAALRFVGADAAHAVAIFTRNATEAINPLAVRLRLPADAVVITTLMEHHSNDLPWRRAARAVHVGVDRFGRVDEDALRGALHEHRGRAAILAVTAASNVSGYVNPVHRWARWAHEAGARIAVDAAQLVPHRPLDVGPAGDPEHLDFVAFSAHKMYAPFGAGVLIGPRSQFADGEPLLVGGGTVAIVDVERVLWAAPPDREEAGTPCVIGAVALRAAIEEIGRIGWPALMEHEAELTRLTLTALREIPEVRIYGDAAPTRAEERLGVVAFNVGDLPHALVSAILAEEWGIGTRNGCFCAHPYAKALLGLEPDEVLALEQRVEAGDHSAVPGMIRASFGAANVAEDAERLGEAVRAIAAGSYERGYVLDRATGQYAHPRAVTGDAFTTWLAS